jgi:hypothetical protein
MIAETRQTKNGLISTAGFSGCLGSARCNFSEAVSYMVSVAKRDNTGYNPYGD